MGQGKDALRTVKQGLVALRQMAGNKIYEAPTTHGEKKDGKMLPIFRCSSKEHHFFLFSSENVDVRKSQKWWFWRCFTCLFWGKIFGYRFFCSKSLEWTTTLIDNISIHNHGTLAYNDFRVNISRVGAKISFSRTSWLNFVRHFENSMRYHCFIPWWAPVSWDMTLMKPCVCAPRKLERSFWDGKISSLGPFVLPP